MCIYVYVLDIAVSSLFWLDPTGLGVPKPIAGYWGEEPGPLSFEPHPTL